MGAVDAPGVHVRDIEVLENIEKKDRRGALAVWGMLHQFVRAVLARYRDGVVAVRPRKVIQSVNATQGLEAGHHVFGYFAFIEPGAAFFGDPA